MKASISPFRSLPFGPEAGILETSAPDMPFSWSSWETEGNKGYGRSWN